MAETEKNSVTIELSGRIDSGNASDTEQQIQAQLDGAGECAVILDAGKLIYISSAGLRVILRIKKSYPELKIINVN